LQSSTNPHVTRELASSLINILNSWQKSDI
jgi:hypothetical protein